LLSKVILSTSSSITISRIGWEGSVTTI
jgi:hypothetical protein